jgi:hypothetical protein
VLGDLHDDAVEITGERRRYRGMAQRIRAHVDGQSHACWQVRPAEESRSNACGFEFSAASGRVGHREDLLHGGWGSGEPSQRLRRHDRSGRHLDDRL